MAGGIAVSPTLLSNAVQYSRGRKRAVIEGDRMTIDGEAAIYARDNGAGFDAKVCGKVCGKLFYPAASHTAEQFEGTGLGLATVQRMIRKHGDRLSAEAEPDKGATGRRAQPETTGTV